jgi:hypothetical protein
MGWPFISAVRTTMVHQHGRGQLRPPKLPPSLPSAGAGEGVKYAGPTPADGGVPPFLRIRRILPLVGRGALVPIGKGCMSLKSNRD